MKYFKNLTPFPLSLNGILRKSLECLSIGNKQILIVKNRYNRGCQLISAPSVKKAPIPPKKTIDIKADKEYVIKSIPPNPTPFVLII